MNAIELLEQQHEEVMKLLASLAQSEPGIDRKQTFKQLQTSLIAHMVIEEEIFYPAVAKAQEEREPLAEGYEEHVIARTAAARCARSIGQDRLFQVRVGVLKEIIAHHIKEERSAILPRAKAALSSEELETLGAQMQERFQVALGATRLGTQLDRMATTRAQRALSA
jgi:hypothetical protein